jgi:hypothetical protein
LGVFGDVPALQGRLAAVSGQQAAYRRVNERRRLSTRAGTGPQFGLSFPRHSLERGRQPSGRWPSLLLREKPGPAAGSMAGRFVRLRSTSNSDGPGCRFHAKSESATSVRKTTASRPTQASRWLRGRRLLSALRR